MKLLSLAFVITVLFISLTSSAEDGQGGLMKAMTKAASGMAAQSERINIITENIVNADTTAAVAGGKPYQRKTIYFKNVYDPEKKMNVLKVDRKDTDKSPFKLVYQPDHPAANERGYVQYPNVDSSLESVDLKDARRSYDSNVTVIENTKGMVERTYELLR